MKKILIAPNSFKECEDSVTVAELIKANFKKHENAELITRPISDGGDGFLNVCKYYFGGEIRKYSVSAPYDDSKFECPVLLNSDQKSIYIESAEVLGLKKVPINKRNPLLLSSKGLGELLKMINHDLINRDLRVDKIYIGIGGTATTDMGIGMLSRLGLELYDSEGKKVPVLPKYFHSIKSIYYKPVQFSFILCPVVDVPNPLFGKESGIKVFSRQKGADTRMIKLLEDYFIYIYKLFNNNKLLNFSEELSGAGGGIAAAFQMFFNSQLIQSENFIFDYLKFGSDISNVDYLITGEGSFDNQSINGKGAGAVIQKYIKEVKKVFLICGEIDKKVISKLGGNVSIIQLIDYFGSKSESIKKFEEGINKACKQISEKIF